MNVWGVDTGLSVTTICALGSGSPVICEAVTTKADGEIAQRLRVLRNGIERCCEGLVADGLDPVFVFVERPTGKFPTPHLDWACGVVTEAIASTLRRINPHETSVWHVPVSTWKKEVVGSGRATKGEVQAWARSIYRNPTEDESDALAIATYAQQQQLKEDAA